MYGVEKLLPKIDFKTIIIGRILKRFFAKNEEKGWIFCQIYTICNLFAYFLHKLGFCAKIVLYKILCKITNKGLKFFAPSLCISFRLTAISDSVVLCQKLILRQQLSPRIRLCRAACLSSLSVLRRGNILYWAIRWQYCLQTAVLTLSDCHNG